MEDVDWAVEGGTVIEIDVHTREIAVGVELVVEEVPNKGFKVVWEGQVCLQLVGMLPVAWCCKTVLKRKSRE